MKKRVGTNPEKQAKSEQAVHDIEAVSAAIRWLASDENIKVLDGEYMQKLTRAISSALSCVAGLLPHVATYRVVREKQSSKSRLHKAGSRTPRTRVVKRAENNDSPPAAPLAASAA